MRGYSLINSEDGLAYDFVVANNAKEAKKMMIENCNDWITGYENPILEFYAKWDKTANIDGLKHGDHVEDIDLIKRGIVSSLEYATCPKCKRTDVTINLMNDNTICCEECEGEE